MAEHDLGRTVVRLMERGDAPIMWSWTTVATLTILCDEPGPHRMRFLAERLGVTGQSIARAMRQLEYHGFARKGVDAADRRDIFLLPTEWGMKARAGFRVEAISGRKGVPMVLPERDEDRRAVARAIAQYVTEESILEIMEKIGPPINPPPY